MEKRVSTEALAEQLGLRPDTIRHRLYRDGSYYGITPLKTPNGRLHWPADTAQRLMKSR